MTQSRIDARTIVVVELKETTTQLLLSQLGHNHQELLEETGTDKTTTM
jgi:hypothetical protein